HRDMIFRARSAQIHENQVVLAMASEEESLPLDSISLDSTQTVVNESQIDEKIPDELSGFSAEFVSDDIAVENEPLEKEPFEEVLSVDGPVKGFGETTNIISESNIIRDEILVDEISGQVVKASLQNTPTTENNDETAEPDDHWKTWPSVEIIEEMVGLAATFGEVDSKEYQGIISQLQEIRHLFIESEERYFASENVQFVIKPHESKYVSMAFCRPTICRKKLLERQT
ncbi:MAG: hypothetical protein FWC50_15670, partial [Planctomycetaceae bacterium]|nr:hypothetical protein [Planctomycetaceae bacterium]